MEDCVIDEEENLKTTDLAPKEKIVKMKHKGELIVDENYKFGAKNPFKKALDWLVYSIVICALFIYNKAYLGLRVKGKKNLRSARKMKRGVISVSNHVHIMDCSMNSTVFAPYHATFTSIASNFTIPVAGSLVKAVGTIPIPENPSGMRFFDKYIAGKLKKNKIVHYYPEGVLYPYHDKIAEFSRGAFAQAVKNNSVILPIVYTEHIARGFYKLIRRNKCCFTANILPPIVFDSAMSPREASFAIMQQAYASMSDFFNKNSEHIYEKNYDNINPEE